MRGATIFAPDVPGTYTLKNEAGRKGRARNHPQTVILEVRPAEQLVCVNTRVSRAGPPTAPLTKVGSAEFPIPDQELNALHVVVLDRATTGEPSDGTPANSTFPENAGGYHDYGTLLAKLNSSDLVLVSGPVRDAGATFGPLERLGAVDFETPQPGGHFSLIGVPGSSKGSAWQTATMSTEHMTTASCGGPQVVGDPASNLSGWLTLDTTGLSYTYVSPDFVDFDTDASAPSGTHAIQVGNRTYPVPTGPWNGFHALVLDRKALCPKATTTDCVPPAPLLNEGFGPQNGGLDALNEKLSEFAKDPDALLFLAPFAGSGGAMPDVEPSKNLVTTLFDFGASPLAPGRSLGDDVKYALVGGGMNTGLPAGSARPIVAESFTDFGGTGQIAGTLVRDHQNRFGPRDASLIGTQLDTLGEVVYGPTSSWPEADDPAREAAFSYISKQLGYPVDADNPQGIRRQYVMWTKAEDVPDPSTRLPQTLCTAERPMEIDATACATVRHELRNEFLEVKWVDDFLTTLQLAYFEVEAGHIGPDLITGVEKDIRKELNPPPEQTSLAVPFVQFVLSLGSVLPGIGEVFEVAGSELDLAESLSERSDGSVADPMQAVYDTGDDLLQASDSAFADAVAQIDTYQPLIVSDYGKLTLVGHRAALDKLNDGTDLATPPWAITNTDLDKARTGLEHALKQWLYPPLVDVGFPVWRIVIPSGDNYDGADRTPVTYRCHAGNFDEDIHPFGQEPADGWIKLDSSHDSYSLALGGTRYTPDELAIWGHHAPVPDAALLKEMFGSAPDHVGLNKAWYFEHGLRREIEKGTELSIDCLSS